MTELDFYRILDKTPDDWQTRLIFADWLEDRGQVDRAEGQRWQVENKRHCYNDTTWGRSLPTWYFLKGKDPNDIGFSFASEGQSKYDYLPFEESLEGHIEADKWLAEQLAKMKVKV